MNPDLAKIIKYVNASADLAEGLERDIKNGNKISSDTVLRLSRLVAATKLVGNLFDFIERERVKLQ